MIAMMALLLGQSAATQASPFQDGNMSLGDTLRQPNTLIKRSNVASGDSKRQWLLDSREAAGLGAVVGLFAIVIFYKARQMRAVAPEEAELLSKHPQLEHPEITLTVVPREALPSAFDSDLQLAR